MYATPTGAADSATKGYVDTAVSGFSGLLTGGSIRKIWAGGKATNTVAHDAVITDAIILGGVFAIVIIPPVRGLGSTFDITPCVLSPVATSDGRIFTIYLTLPKAKQDDLKDVGGYVAGSLQGLRRKADAVSGRDVVTLDLDTQEPPQHEAFETRGRNNEL